jgi:hypothetical protein
VAVTDEMALLMNRLRTDPVTQEAFRQDRAQAIAGYDLTGHERDAILTRDCDDLVALGLASNTAGLPDVLDCPGFQRPTVAPGILDRLTGGIGDLIRPIRDRLPIPDRLRLPRPFGPRPTPPGPKPPDPEPRPRPTPGPDPPGPDRPGGGG